MSTFKDSIFYVLLYLLPKNLVSLLMGKLVSLKLPRLLAIKINKLFAKAFKINLLEASKPIEEYSCLQDFFIRELKSHCRPILGGQNELVSPCDGYLSQFGMIKEGLLIQVKAKNYSLSDLLASEDLAKKFSDGYYATIYLSPKDYHRFHVPISCEVSETIYIPGSLWPVNNWAVKNIKSLFCQNERIISLLKCLTQNKMLAQIAVGATMVGKVKLNYCDVETNINNQHLRLKHDEKSTVSLKKGDELGKFMFGSTIIMIFEAGLISRFEKISAGPVKMGEILAVLSN